MLDDASETDKVNTSVIVGPSDQQMLGTLGGLSSLASSKVKTLSRTTREGRKGIVYARALARVAKTCQETVVALVWSAQQKCHHNTIDQSRHIQRTANPTTQ